ncbi:hypothetical protein [Acinetobacter pragensis]|uniref:Uncharacterized protein n=1 Tax=Acinetobacter pragensis TaxID=1806892 RepID=A0A151Y6F8_9GAMM|nr:hypothetical protein [Acinetobacter pragensis]KYQ73613.1 hypothetical protein AZH43_00395 [Acinetobacter pragensis]
MDEMVLAAKQLNLAGTGIVFHVWSCPLFNTGQSIFKTPLFKRGFELRHAAEPMFFGWCNGLACRIF